MAVYKVPQDVEAEDHLIGPFGFRQFIYLIIVAAGCFVAYLLSKVFIGLILIPAPIIIFFFIIAMPFRKDQPTEVYLAAVLQFNLKSKKRLWQPDGVISTVEITAPKKVEVQRTKDISEDEALDRLGHLAQIMDTRGWAARGVFNPDVDSMGNVMLADKVVEEANHAEDILDSGSTGAQSFDQLIDQQKAISKHAVMEKMTEANQPTAPAPTVQKPANAYEEFLSQAPPAIITPVAPTPQAETAEDLAVIKATSPSPYPTAIHQQVVQPISQNPAPANVVASPAPEVTIQSQPQVINAPVAAESTSSEQRSADIIGLAENPDLTVQTMANEARRIEEKSEEVEIKLH